VNVRATPGVWAPTRSARSSVALATVTAVNRLSRTLGRGSGTVAGGRAGLVVDPGLLATLATGRCVALVTGTNGKTTTTRLLAAALAGPEGDLPVSNDTGSNMPAGHVAALAGSPGVPLAVLEVDEGYLGRLITEAAPAVVVLLNLSRDQLDRISEVRMLVDRWRLSLAGLSRPTAPGGGTVVVANADDPMVAFAASAAPEVCWVGAGQMWHDDAVGCPACGGRIGFADDGAWACDRCEFARPEVAADVDGSELVLADGTRLAIRIGLPGQFNRANAAMAAMAAAVIMEATVGTMPSAGLAMALGRLGGVTEVAGRFSTIMRGGRPVRLLLAKNPAGWTAIFDLLDETGKPDAAVVLSVNARTADGFDTSWLWDVPFERLAGHRVVATGDRRLDLAVRLRYADVEHLVIDGPVDALDHAVARTGNGSMEATAGDGAAVEFVGNYTAFADLRRAL
jgi:UDP-N-acetylmuramyl tripeptide synthase